MNPQPQQGIDAVMLAHRDALIRFLAAHATGDEAEDLYHELWLRLREKPTGPIANPLAYLYRAANNLAIDRHRARRQAAQRDEAWSETHAGEAQPGAERALISRDELARTERLLATMGDRVLHVVRRFRLDGMPQRQIAAELNVSLSTVESDLRRAYAAMLDARRQDNDG